jgi:hypothetical protein
MKMMKGGGGGGFDVGRYLLFARLPAQEKIRDEGPNGFYRVSSDEGGCRALYL